VAGLDALRSRECDVLADPWSVELIGKRREMRQSARVGSFAASE
jgi:hypothetical protein